MLLAGPAMHVQPNLRDQRLGTSTSSPSTSVRSTPVTRYSCSRRLKGSGLCLDLLRFFLRVGGKGCCSRFTFASQPDSTWSLRHHIEQSVPVETGRTRAACWRTNSCSGR